VHQAETGGGAVESDRWGCISPSCWVWRVATQHARPSCTEAAGQWTNTDYCRV